MPVQPIKPAIDPARQQFIAIALFTILANTAFQYLSFLLFPLFHPVIRGLLETLAVAILAVPPSYYFYIRPLYASFTERQIAETTLRVIRATPVILWELDKDGTVLLSEGSALSRLQLKPGELVGKSVFDAFKNASEVVAHVRSGLAGEETIAETPIGDSYWRSHFVPRRDEKGQISGLVGVSLDITKRKKAEEALRESEQKYRILYEEQVKTQNLLEVSQRLAHIGSWEYELSTGSLTCSNEMFRIAGVPTSSPITPEFADSFFPPDELTRLRKAVAAALQDDSLYAIDLKIRRRDGEYRIIHTEAEVLRDEYRNAIRICGTTQDITERKLAEEALKDSEERFRRTFQHSASGMALVSVERKFLQVNDAFCSLLGYSASELLEMTFQDVTLPEDRPLGNELGVRLLSGEIDHFHFEKRYRHKNGTIVWAIVSSTLLRNAEGKPLNFVAQIQDITERKIAEEALRESEEKFRSIVQQSADGIVVMAQDGAIVEWNKAQETLTGLKRSDAVGNPIWDVQSTFVPTDRKTPELLSRIQTDLEAFLRGDTDWGNEKRERRILLPDGSEKIVLESAFLVRQGERNMGVSLHSDITDKKRAESDRATVERYIQQAQKLESLGVLAGGIAHDFNNLLSGVFGFLDLARNHVEDETASSYLSQAVESIDRAKGLTQQLLTFSKGGEPIRKLVAISSLIKETCNFALSGANVKCTYRIANELWHCHVDKNQIGQVIQNLMLNAIQAMPMGGLIEVSAENLSISEMEHPLLSKGTYVLISVKDEGIGIPQEMLPRIFDPFFTTKIKGHGLGLATTYSIVKRHDGTIGVDSTLGKGSTFRVYLPADSKAISDRIETIDVTHSGKGTILVMDDDSVIRTFLSKALESLGYSVVCKEDGRSTVDYFKEQAEKGTQPSAVWLDLTIPGGMGGKEVAEEVRKLNKEIPIFVSSGYADDPVIANPVHYGITASLSKPFRRVELMEMLERHMRKEE